MPTTSCLRWLYLQPRLLQIQGTSLGLEYLARKHTVVDIGRLESLFVAFGSSEAQPRNQYLLLVTPVKLIWRGFLEGLYDDVGSWRTPASLAVGYRVNK